MPDIASSPLSSGVVRLQHYGVIRALGADAAKFLHSQLTQDFALLDASTARLAAYCSPKGRMLASFIGLKNSPEEILLICNTDLLAQTLKRLKMFVMRAQVALSDASPDFTIYGLTGSATISAKPVSEFVGSTHKKGEITLIDLSACDGVARQICIQQSSHSSPAGAELSLDLWNWSEVHCGVAMMTATMSEAFVPQMLNYESVGGVNFKKGCYPGQEIVARSQFRGTLKRRAFLVHSGQMMKSGDEIHAAASNGEVTEPVGVVVQCASAPQGGFEAIVCLQTAAAAGELHHANPNGASLQLQDLPYPLLEDI